MYHTPSCGSLIWDSCKYTIYEIEKSIVMKIIITVDGIKTAVLLFIDNHPVAWMNNSISLGNDIFIPTFD